MAVFDGFERNENMDSDFNPNRFDYLPKCSAVIGSPTTDD